MTVCTNTIQAVRTSCHKLPWWMKPFCNEMNPNPSHNQRNGTTQHLQGRLNAKVGHKQEGTWLRVILDKMGGVSLNFVPREELWILTAKFKHEEVWNLIFIEYIPQEKFQNSLIKMPDHTQVSILHTPLKIWMKSAAAPTLHSWILHQIFIGLVLARQPARTLLHDRWSTAECHVSVAVYEGKKFL